MLGTLYQCRHQHLYSRLTLVKSQVDSTDYLFRIRSLHNLHPRTPTMEHYTTKVITWVKFLAVILVNGTIFAAEWIF